jgi:hypothetical protein
MISKKIIFIGYILLLTFDHWSKGISQKLWSKAPPYGWSKNHPNHTRLVKINLFLKTKGIFLCLSLWGFF